MTFQLSLKGDMKKFTKRLNSLQRKQIPFAAARALTKTAQDAKIAVVGEMKKTFKSPTRFTLNSIFVKTATKKNLFAVVGIKNIAGVGTAPSKYLQAQIHGGRRKLKPLEKLLQSKGLLPSGMRIVPARGIKLNKFGNVTRARVSKVVSGLSGKSMGKKSVFAAKIKNVHGVWEKSGKNIKLLFLFVKDTRYTKKLDFMKIVKRRVATRFPVHFRQSLKIALASAR